MRFLQRGALHLELVGFPAEPGGIRQGAMVVVHLVLILVFCMVLTITTEPMEITHGLEELLSPLSKVGVPTEEIAMILGVAMQFIPVLGEEAERSRMAQTARGARFESKKLTDRAASFLPLVIPVFLAAFRRADELACAMEARGYRGPGRRTKKKNHCQTATGMWRLPRVRFFDYAGILAKIENNA